MYYAERPGQVICVYTIMSLLIALLVGHTSGRVLPSVRLSLDLLGGRWAQNDPQKVRSPCEAVRISTFDPWAGVRTMLLKIRRIFLTIITHLWPRGLDHCAQTKAYLTPQGRILGAKS